MSYRVLLLEDDKLFNETMEDFLDEEGFEVYRTLDPYTAMDYTYKYKFDIYLFDVNLPYESGFTLLKNLRLAGDTTPCIFLTSREDKASIKEGFGLGGDDYMKKPIDLDELLLRILAILRRQTRGEKITIGEYIIDCQAKKLYHNGELMKVTTKAIELLLLFIASKGEIVTLSQIENRLWHIGEEISYASIRVYINTLKKYFPNRIENIRGVGYRFIFSSE